MTPQTRNFCPTALKSLACLISRRLEEPWTQFTLAARKPTPFQCVALVPAVAKTENHRYSWPYNPVERAVKLGRDIKTDGPGERTVVGMISVPPMLSWLPNDILCTTSYAAIPGIKSGTMRDILNYYVVSCDIGRG